MDACACIVLNLSRPNTASSHPEQKRHYFARVRATKMSRVFEMFVHFSAAAPVPSLSKTMEALQTASEQSGELASTRPPTSAPMRLAFACAQLRVALPAAADVASQRVRAASEGALANRRRAQALATALLRWSRAGDGGDGGSARKRSEGIGSKAAIEVERGNNRGVPAVESWG
eukprot:6204150-Pleurochrysis_carterae.AAC.2